MQNPGSLNFLGTYPITTVTPFTYREGATMLHIMEKFKNWAIDMGPEVQEIIDKAVADWQERFDAFELTVTTNIANTKNQWQILFDEFMADVINRLEVLNDQAVANLINRVKVGAVPASKTRVALEDHFALKSEQEAIVSAVDSSAYFDNIKIVAVLPLRPAGTNLWIQGFNVNYDDEEIYIARQESGGDELTVTIYGFDGVVRDSKSIPMENFAYTESLPYFKQGSQLKFLVRTGSHSNTDNSALKVPQLQNSYNIWNYSTGNLGPRRYIKGAWRASRQGDYLVTTDSWTDDVSRIYFYDWASVEKNSGNPTLLKTVVVTNAGETAAKNQGLGATESSVILYGGSPSQFPTFTVYNHSGELQSIRAWSRVGLAEALNKLQPGIVVNKSNYRWEAEGAETAGGRFHSGHVIIEDGASNDTGKFVIVRHSSITGEPVAPALPPNLADVNTDWMQFGASHINKFFLRREGNVVYGWMDGAKALPEGVTTIFPSGTIPLQFRPRIGHARFFVSMSFRVGVAEILQGGGLQIQNWTGAAHTSINGTAFNYNILPFEKLERG